MVKDAFWMPFPWDTHLINMNIVDKTNILKSKGDLNLWINSKQYNVIESTNHLWLLMIIDLINN